MRLFLGLLLCVLSVPSAADEKVVVLHDETGCEALLDAAADPLLDPLLVAFPNQIQAQTGYVPLDQKIPAYIDALSALPDGVQVVPFNVFTGGILGRGFDYRRLLGLRVIGRLASLDYPLLRRGGRQHDHQYVAGTIVGVKSMNFVYEGHRLPEDWAAIERAVNLMLSVRTAEGAITDAPYMIDHHTNELLVLQPRRTPAEVLKIALDHSDYRSWVSDAFGMPSEPMDFQVARKMIQLYFEMPPSFGVPSVAGLLRGTKDAVRKHADFGMLAGHKRYSTKNLAAFLSNAQKFMQSQGVESSKLIPDHYIPTRTPGELRPAFLQLIDENTPAVQADAVLPVAPVAVYTAKDFEKAATALIDPAALMTQTRDLKAKLLAVTIPDAKLDPRATGFGEGHLRLISKSKNKALGGTTYKYAVELQEALWFSVHVARAEGDGTSRYSLMSYPTLEVTFGPTPADVLQVVPGWTFDTHRERIPVEATVDALLTGIARYHASLPID